MALHSYGLLVGKIVGFREPRGHRPHWLLFIQPSEPEHPPYRVGLNAPTYQPADQSEIEYQVVPLKPALPLVGKLRALAKKGGTPNFLLASQDDKLPRLDYADSSLVDPLKFQSEKTGEPKVQRKTRPQPVGDLQSALRLAVKEKAMVAVFGTGAPTDHRSGAVPATGFTGVDNVHMNQGAFNRTNGTLHYLENGRAQDGGLIVLGRAGATGIFIKFRSQTTKTDERGHPTVTGIAEIDAVPARVRAAITPRAPREPGRQPFAVRPLSVGAAAVHHAAPPSSPGNPNNSGYVFADFDPNDSSGKYIPDNDANTYQTPIVQQQSLGHTRGPVPTPRENPVMTLTSIVGASPPGTTDDNSGQSIAFDVIGDSGAPSQQKLEGYETKVADLLARDAAASRPAFMFHVGDVVYFYGEQNYYYSQFYEPFRAYPAPIFAVPGNHDGVIYDAAMTSLDAFQQAFCAKQPGRWVGSGGILRSTMTQPGVYFTLDAPLVSIIGLYSNCGESLGWLDEQQLAFLYKELVRLKAMRQNGLPAVILAIHHFPRWFPGQKDPMSTAIDDACTKANFWPDAVICGHAHLYQRVVRPDAGRKGRDMPYVLSGSGGYGITPSEEEGKLYMQKIGVSKDKANRLGCVIFESGYVRTTVTKPARGNPTVKFEYRSVKPTSSQADDVCVVDLVAGSVIA
jgi:uncharacterized protein YukJ